VSGDKVYLGQFGPDTVIGFACLANGYISTNNTVGNGSEQFYSNPVLNPESNSSQRNHNVALWDQPSQNLIIGFEAINRTSSDDDFNDAVFYLSSYPANSISTTNIVNTSISNDTDGDGISDNYDEYPTDPDIAFNSYYPSSTTWANIGFEDLWPYKGDYDMNDLIVGYRMNLVKNSSNEVKQIQTKVFVKAIGGSYQNGFGFELPISPNDISAVTGSSLNANYISTNANGTEANQANAVIIAFDNALNIAPRPAGYYVNTQLGSPIVYSDTLRLGIYFTNAISMSTLGTAPFNPFMISNLRRGYEIHLPDKAPTSLADQSIFNTGNDKSNAALGRYYRSDRNLPWAINVPDNYPIVVEKNQIINAYLKFEDWSQSGGATYNDWYENKSGYRDDTKLLNR
jgi:LruC domain-containing protein